MKIKSGTIVKPLFSEMITLSIPFGGGFGKLVRFAAVQFRITYGSYLNCIIIMKFCGQFVCSSVSQLAVARTTSGSSRPS